MSPNLRAEEIVEDLLYETGRALSGEIHEIGDLFEVPQIMETPEGKRLVETEDDARRVLAGVRAYFEESGVTDIVRTVISAEFLSPDLIGSSHVTQLLREGGEPFRAPYPVYTITRRSQGLWRVSASIIAIMDCAKHVAALTGPIRPVSDHGLLQALSRNGGSEGRPRP